MFFVLKTVKNKFAILLIIKYKKFTKILKVNYYISKKYFQMFLFGMKIKGINFSTQYTKGSVVDRNNTANRIRAEIFNNVIKEFNKPQKNDSSKKLEFIPISHVEKLIKEKLPEPLKLIFKKVQLEKRDLNGAMMAIYNETGTKYYRMEVEAVKNQLPITNVPTLMHETTHLLDAATNPQYGLIDRQLCKKELNEKVDDFYMNTFYTDKLYPKFITKRKTRKFLKDMPVEDQLLVLRYFKLSMLTEIRAYEADKEFAKKISPWNNKKIQGYDELTYKCFGFEKNIKLVDKMRANIIRKERNKIRNTRKNIFC